MFIEAVPEDAADGLLADYYRRQRAAWGFLPNYAAAFATRPDVAQAWDTLRVHSWTFKLPRSFQPTFARR